MSGIAAKHSLVTSSTNVEDTKPAAVGELVMNEIHRPARVDLGVDDDRSPRPLVVLLVPVIDD